ncbi:uncharacterized protein LOC114762117 [Neltuma alba]|uniref:uncharacterized protein LOC114715401 n=1 Tax=Neltuma alba TaxID=207710 RepID=UPI0010A3C159|nr:uncharacterized protein LOC114715401 [Prosopis alba]XP_028807412.1 uncharacterized protein LOC114762117 [Prosopis alba]
MNLQNRNCLNARNGNEHPNHMRLGRNHSLFVSEIMSRLNMSRWKSLWRKILRKKKRFFSCSSSVRVQYDPDSYSHNFDDYYSSEPDNISRSFSARFAVPSRICDKNEGNRRET